MYHSVYTKYFTLKTIRRKNISIMNELITFLMLFVLFYVSNADANVITGDKE